MLLYVPVALITFLANEFAFLGLVTYFAANPATPVIGRRATRNQQVRIEEVTLHSFCTCLIQINSFNANALS
jgi:hypothetical protein